MVYGGSIWYLTWFTGPVAPTPHIPPRDDIQQNHEAPGKNYHIGRNCRAALIRNKKFVLGGRGFQNDHLWTQVFDISQEYWSNWGSSFVEVLIDGVNIVFWRGTKSSSQLEGVLAIVPITGAGSILFQTYAESVAGILTHDKCNFILFVGCNSTRRMDLEHLLSPLVSNIRNDFINI